MRKLAQISAMAALLYCGCLALRPALRPASQRRPLVMCENPVQDPADLKAALKELQPVLAAKQADGSAYLQQLMKLTPNREKNDELLEQLNPELFAEIEQLVLQASDLEGRVNLLESGTTKRLSSVGRMRATEEKRSQLEADGISPETGEAVDPAKKSNGLIVLGFRALFVAIILGGGAVLVSIVGAGGVVQVAQDITGASAAPQ